MNSKLKNTLKKVYLDGLFCLPHNRIYSFHRICDDPLVLQVMKDHGMQEETFQSFILEHGPYVSLEELCSRNRMDHTAAITFDDGLRDVYTVAYPFLREHRIPFTAFILIEKLDQPGYMTTEQLLEIAEDPLVTIGSHGLSHLRLSDENAETQQRDLSQSKEKLEQMLHRPCRYFAYPYGAYNDTTLKLVKEAGYEMAFAVGGRPLLSRVQKPSFTIPRMSVSDETLVFYRKS